MAENGESVQVAETAAENTPAMEADLLPHILPHLDRHLIYPLLDFMEAQAESDEEANEVLKMKYQLLKETNMFEFVSNLDMQIRGSEEGAQEWATKQEQATQKREQLEQQAQRLFEIMENPDITTNLRADKISNLNWLKENHGVTIEEVNALYETGQFLYSIGDYGATVNYLDFHRILVSSSLR